MTVANRFASLPEFVVETYNNDGLIDFGAPTTAPTVADSESEPASGQLLH